MLSESRNLLTDHISRKTGTPIAQRIKQKVRWRNPRPWAVSITLYWACFSHDVDLDGGLGSEVYFDKQVVFVAFLVYSVFLLVLRYIQNR